MTVTITPEQITAAVEAVKAEIREHVGTGIIPADVADFSTLHNYLDANMLGGEATDALWDDDADHDDPNTDPYAALNAMQTAVDQWIKDGGLRDAEHPTCSHCGAPIIHRRGSWIGATDEDMACTNADGSYSLHSLA